MYRSVTDVQTDHLGLPQLATAAEGGVRVNGGRNVTASRTLSGLVWTFLGTGVRGAVQLLVLTVLAHLLSVEDFGVVTAALAVIGLSVNLSPLGFGSAVVQLPELEPRHVRTAFTASIFFGAVAAAVIWAIAPLLAVFFRMPPLTPILRVLCWACLFQGAYIVAESLLQRKMQFRLLAALDATTYIIGYGIVGITLALLRCGVWAFVGAHLAQAIARGAILLATQRHAMIPRFERRAFSELLMFGGGLTIGKIGNYVAVEGDNVVVGRSLGAAALGVYGRAYQLMVMPAMFVGEVLDRVLFPGMARLQRRPRRLGVAYRRFVALTALLILPLSGAVFVLAPEIVRVLLGEKWTGVIVPLQIFAAGMLFRTSYKISDVAVRATGAVYRRAYRQAAYAAFVLAGAWAGQRWGLSGVAAGVTVAIVLNFALMAELTLKLTHLSWSAFTRAHLPGAVVAVALSAEMWFVAAPLREWRAPPVVVLLVVGTVALITALAALRCAPPIILGQDGRWLLQTLASAIPARIRALTRYRSLLAGTDGRPKVLRVEFIGLPGAGKSTVARRVVAMLRDLEIPARDCLHDFAGGSRRMALAWKLTVVARGVLFHPWFAYCSARAIGTTGQRSAKDALKVIHNWILVTSLMQSRARGEAVQVFDQGIFQALWSIGFSSEHGDIAAVWGRLRRLAPKPELVVVVEADPPQIAERRLATRSEGRGARIEKFPPGHPIWLRAEALLSETKSAAAQLAGAHGPVRMIVVDNSREGNLEETASRLAAYIRTLYLNKALPASSCESQLAGAGV